VVRCTRKGALHAIDVSDGKRLWVQRLDDHPIARLIGTPQLHAASCTRR
jgi:hypothetical protein